MNTLRRIAQDAADSEIVKRGKPIVIAAGFGLTIGVALGLAISVKLGAPQAEVKV